MVKIPTKRGSKRKRRRGKLAPAGVRVTSWTIAVVRESFLLTGLLLRRLAKRIAKRAKMQRILAEFGDALSQSQTLMQEDDDEIKRDLEMIKPCKKKGGFIEEFGEESQSNFAGNFGSAFNTQSFSQSQSEPQSDSQPQSEPQQDSEESEQPSLFSRLAKPLKRKASEPSVAPPLADSTNSSSFGSNGALAMALKASRKVGTKKFKSNFLGKTDGDSSRLSRGSSAGSKSLALGHVLFDTSSKSQFGRSDGDSSYAKKFGEQVSWSVVVYGNAGG